MSRSKMHMGSVSPRVELDIGQEQNLSVKDDKALLTLGQRSLTVNLPRNLGAVLLGIGMTF